MAPILRSASGAGAAAGLGAATADGFYAGVAVFLGAALAPLIVPVATPLRWVSAAVLVLLGLLMIRPALTATASSSDAAGAAPRALSDPGRAYAAVLGITLVNPTTVVYFAALVVGARTGDLDDLASGLLFVVGALIASAAWQLLLAGAGSVLGQVVTGPRGRRWTAVVGGSIVMFLAVRTAVGF